MGSWGKTDTLADAPKWLNANDPNASNDLDYALFIDITEAQQEVNRDKGIKTPGWNLYREYTTNGGTVTRRSIEPLVAISVPNSISGDNDTIAPAPVITIGTQPQAVSITEGETATFTVVATVTQGATATYQWQKSDDSGSNWANVTGATAASYTTGALTNADDDQDEYRVIVSVLGGTSVTSDAAIVSVATL